MYVDCATPYPKQSLCSMYFHMYTMHSAAETWDVREQYHPEGVEDFQLY
jgi:hypothetical protein